MEKAKQDIIVALATPPLKSALALIRCSGDGVFSLFNDIFSKTITPVESRKMAHGKIMDGDRPVDDVMLFLYPTNSSMTGEESIEITCHGSMLIANEIISLLISKGARYASKGEFTSRAFFNGKMNLIEAEAVNDLINATTKEAKNLSLMSLGGKSTELVRPLKKEIADLLSLIEVNIDYPEYTDIEEANEEKIVSSIDEINKNVLSLLTQGRAGRIIKDGVKVAIVGKPNAGKSSLLNALLDQDKAIVTDIPGTTRDIVEGDAYLDGITIHLLDTAGIRDNAGDIEKIGIEKSMSAINESEFVILVVDATKGMDDEDEEILAKIGDKPTIIAMNKCDLCKIDGDFIKISAANKDVSQLTKQIKLKLNIEEKDFNTPSLSNERQMAILRRIQSLLNDAKNDCLNMAPIDLVSASLLSAYAACEELIGEKITLDLTDEIFSRFCVGK